MKKITTPIFTFAMLFFVPTLVGSLRTRSPAWLLHLAILHYVANSVIFFANIRYRAPVDPICFILTAWTIMRFVSLFRPPVPSSSGIGGSHAGERGVPT